MRSKENVMLAFFLFLITSTSLYSQDTDSVLPSVLVIGHGFMGANHVKNLEILQDQKLVKIVGIVDIDEKKLTQLPYPSFQDSFEACQALSPDIVVIATNTNAHYETLQSVLEATQEKLPALFIEKPLVETSAQMKRLSAELKDYPAPITCGYLFRYSPIIDKAICYIKLHHLKIEHIQVRWQKKRVPTRPSAGVHIDEATHPVDLILNRLFPALGIPSEPLLLTCLSRKYDDSIVDQSLQKSFYPEKVVPLAEVAFEMRTPEVAISVLSSFLQPPQIREIVLHCSSNAEIKLNFDKDQTDQLSITSSFHPPILDVALKPNKLLIEWQAFLDYYQTRKSSDVHPTLQDMAKDIQITEMLDEIPLCQEYL
jgi:predicted dehydrogenase